MQKITPCLWFDGNAEEAIDFYTSVFKNSKKLNKSYYDKASSEVSGQKEGALLTGTFEIEGQKIMILNGGPAFKLTEAFSFVVDCKDQEEIDYFWNKLSEGGEESVCGWLKDKFGVSWQIVPTIWDDLVNDRDKAKSERVMKAMLGMKKLDIESLQKAADAE